MRQQDSYEENRTKNDILNALDRMVIYEIHQRTIAVWYMVQVEMTNEIRETSEVD
jgi:hypothetical protein